MALKFATGLRHQPEVAPQARRAQVGNGQQWGQLVHWKQPAVGQLRDDVEESGQPFPKKAKAASGPQWKKCPEEGNAFPSSSERSWKKPDVSASSGAPAAVKAGKTIRHHVCLDMPTLSLVKSSDDLPMTEYRRKALDPDRTARVMLQPCSCKNNCFSVFQRSQVIEICQLWHSISEESQHHFLNAQWECSADEGTRRMQSGWLIALLGSKSAFRVFARCWVLATKPWRRSCKG